MRYRLFATLVIMIFGAASALAASDNQRSFVLKNTQILTIDSEQTGRRHELIIALPDSYHQSPDKKYPVLYFLDAYWDTPLLNGVYGTLIYDRVVPEFIMVGFSYPDGANYDQERLLDFTPTQLATARATTGGGPEFLKFIKESVVPMVEKNYRADSDQRALAGSSLGGLFTLYAMYEAPEFFDRYIAISPAVSWGNNYVAKRDAEYAKKHKALNARLFLSYGTEEYKPFAEPIADYQQQIEARKYQGLQLMNYKMNGLRHAGVKGEGFVHGLMWGWKDIAPKGPGGLENSYRARGE